MAKARMLVNRVVAAVRAWAFNKLPEWVVKGMKLTPDDFQALAVRAARSWGEPGKLSSDVVRSVQFSQNEFEATAQRYGGQAAWEAASAAGQTVLTYRQWVQVRTPAFKRWFGDWENEKTTAGLVGDESGRNAGLAAGADTGRGGDVQRVWRLNPDTGEPNRFYHGTSDAFTRFDLNHPNRKDKGWLGRGIYTASDYRLASSYANLKAGADEPRVMELFVNVRNPRVFTVKEKQKLASASQAQIDACSPRLWG